jgi:hypothetical protein
MSLAETTPISTTGTQTVTVETGYAVRVGVDRAADGSPAYTVALDVNDAPLVSAPLVLPVLPQTTFGLVYPPSDATAHKQYFTTNPMIRYYNPAGTGIKGWATAPMKLYIDGQIVTVSFEDDLTDAVLAQLRALFAGTPVTCPKLRIIWRHEYHGTDVDAYKAGWNVIRNERDAFLTTHPGFLTWIELAENYMRYQIDEQNQNIEACHPRRPDGSNTCDIFTVDVYSPENRDGFLPAPTMLGHTAALAAQYGMRFGFAECGGSVADPTVHKGRTPDDQAVYIGQLGAEANRLGADDLSWFSSNTGRYPYRLLDHDQSAAAYRKLQPA